MNNWYEKLPSQLKRDAKLDKNFKKHHIMPNSMICCIGGTGSGKSNALMEMLSRMNEKFYDIIYFNPVSSDEPLINLLKTKIPELKLYNDINELPELSTFDNDEKDLEKLFIADDIINMNKKDFKKINEYLTGGRKMGFTCYIMGQNYTGLNKTIVRNCHYFMLFRLNDNITINNIIRNHNVNGVKKDKFKELYLDATSEPMNFFMIDLRGKPETHLRKNFLNFYNLSRLYNLVSLNDGLFLKALINFL